VWWCHTIVEGKIIRTGENRLELRIQEGDKDVCEQLTVQSLNLLPMKQHSSQQHHLDEQSHSSKMLLPMMKSRQQINFSQQVFGQMQPFFLWNTQYNKDAVNSALLGQ
jgi:hypothetical protein